MARTKKTTGKKENYQQKLHSDLHALVKKMIEKMEDGTGKWVKCWSAPHGFPMNFKTKKEYRGFNFFYLNFIMIDRGYKAPYFLTFKQANELGGKIKKGAKSIPVYFYKMMDYSNVVIDDKTGEEEIIKKTVPLLKEYKVFNIEDIENIDYEIIDNETNDNERYEEVDNFLKYTNAKIRNGGNSAFYNRTTDYINVPNIEYFNDSDNYYAVTLHELTHWSGAEHRLDRTKGKKFGDKNYAFEELIAELGSVFLCSHLGIRIENNQHPEYLQSWINSLKEDPQILWKAGSKAQEAFDYIKKLVDTNKEHKEAIAS